MSERNYGIDLLRIVLMFMVCILHTLGRGGILYSCDVDTIRYKIYWLLEIFSYCAVDGFALISGYMSTGKPRKYEKLVNMWFQALFYSFVVTIFFTIIGINKDLNISEIIKCMTPVTSVKFWYFTAFFGLFFVTPIIDRFVISVNDLTAKKTLCMTFLLFSIIGIINDPFCSEAGYSTIWLIVLYFIGSLSRKIKLFEEKSNFALAAIWLCCSMVTWALLIFKGDGKLINYISPTILINGMVMVILFSRLKLKGNIISKISPLVFGVYLFQLNQVVWNSLLQNAFVFVAGKHTLIGVMYVFVFSSLIFILGLIIEFFRHSITNILDINSISKIIAKNIDKLITASFKLLK